MKIRAIHVEGFGVWRQLRLEGFQEGLNLIYGPNEAGKTTLLEFVRSVLYGFGSAWGSYLPPVHSSRAGGWLEVAVPQGIFRIQRVWSEELMPEETCRGTSASEEERKSAGKNGPAGRVRILGHHGILEEESLLRSWLGGVDETIYQNIFALGLREIQQLGLLSQTEAAHLLYALSAGVDRVSLVQVMEELRIARERLLAPGDQPCQLGELSARQEKLRREIHAARQSASQYPHLLAQRDQADHQAQQLQSHMAELQEQLRLVETAIGLRDRLQRRARLDAQLAAFPSGRPVSAEMLQQWEELAEAIRQHQAQIADLRTQCAQWRRQLEGLTTDSRLLEQRSRIRAFVEQLPWLSSLEQRMSALQEEIAALETKLAQRSQQIGLEETHWLEESAEQWVGSNAPRIWDRLREPADKIHRFRRRLRQAEQRAATARQTAEALQEQLQQALADRGCSDLATALQETSQLLSQLRRRQQIDKQLVQIQRQQGELSEEAQRLMDRQSQPMGELIGWGALFVLGVGLVLWGGILPGVGVGSLNLLTTTLGVAALVGAVVGNLLLRHNRRRQIQTYSQHRKMLQAKARQLHQEREALDAAIPPGSGSLAERIEHLQRELSLLEQLTPLDARREAAWQEVHSAEQSLQECQHHLQDARRRWQETLEVLGLPPKLSPSDVRKLQDQGDRLAETHHQLQKHRQEYAYHQQQWEELRNRIRQLATELGLQPAHLNPTELVRMMEEKWKAEEIRLEQRRHIVRQVRQVRPHQRRLRRNLRRLQLQQRRLLRQAGVTSEEAFRRRAAETLQIQQLTSERQAVQREIEAALADNIREEDLAPLLESTKDLETQRTELADKIHLLQQELQVCYERRGQLNEQLRHLAEDATLPQKRLQWRQLEREIAETSRRWQVLALTTRLFDQLRTRYERQYQPETLQEASEYFRRMTQGRYVRVWRPLDKEELWVDMAEGGSLPVERLSHGTRELLFLSLRLALAAAYGRRGVVLPMILDDVMVNFDTERARSAARVLWDFAQQGRQILLFTCHEHLQTLFHQLRIPHATLPDWSQQPIPKIRLESPGAEKKVPIHPVELPLEKSDDAKPEVPTAEEPGFEERIEESPSASLESLLPSDPEELLEGDTHPEPFDRRNEPEPPLPPTEPPEAPISSDFDEEFQWYEDSPEEIVEPSKDNSPQNASPRFDKLSVAPTEKDRPDSQSSRPTFKEVHNSERPESASDSALPPPHHVSSQRMSDSQDRHSAEAA